MYIKIHKSYRDVVALCDSEILGQRFEEGLFQLDVKKSFFEGEELSSKEIIKILKVFSAEDATFNIVGKRSTDAAKESGIITDAHIKTISNIPFALVLE